MDQDWDKTRELVDSPDSGGAVLFGGRVLEPMTFAEDDEAKVLDFTRAQYRFLDAYRLGVPIEEAAAKAKMTESAAKRFLESEKFIQWRENRMRRKKIIRDWAQDDRWWEEMEKCYLSSHVPKHKIDILKEFGDRVCPKVSRNADKDTKTVIEINIDPDAIARSKERRKVIEAQIIEGDQKSA